MSTRRVAQLLQIDEQSTVNKQLGTSLASSASRKSQPMKIACDTYHVATHITSQEHSWPYYVLGYANPAQWDSLLRILPFGIIAKIFRVHLTAVQISTRMKFFQAPSGQVRPNSARKDSIAANRVSSQGHSTALHET